LICRKTPLAIGRVCEKMQIRQLGVVQHVLDRFRKRNDAALAVFSGPQIQMAFGDACTSRQRAEYQSLRYPPASARPEQKKQIGLAQVAARLQLAHI
jgi:hypothetical protein